MGDTYGHTRRMQKVENYNDRNRGNVTDRAFPMLNRPNQYVNCAVGDQGGNQDTLDYNNEESGNPEYYGDRSEGQSLLTENGDDSSSIELETAANDGRNADSEAES